MKANKYKFLLIIIFVILLYYNAQETGECPKERPIRNNRNGQCELIPCPEENIENGDCFIENEKVKIQWLNNIISSKEIDIYSFAATSYNKDIIILSYKEAIEEGEQNLMYLLTKNNNELLLNTITVSETIGEFYLIFNILPIQKNEQSDIYLFTCIYISCLLINKNNNEIIKKFSLLNELIGVDLSERNILFKLNDNNYLYAILNNNGNLIMTKFNLIFNHDNSFEIDSRYIYEGEEICLNQDIQCFQTDNNIIECMLLYRPTLSILIFNENLEMQDSKEIDINEHIISFNLKCIHLQGELGIYNYFIDYDSILKILELKYDGNSYQLYDIFENTNLINISYDGTNHPNIQSDLLKISNTRFGIFYIDNINDYLLIILCHLYGNNNNNLISRYYKIYYDLYQFNSCLKLITFMHENHIVLSMTDNEYDISFAKVIIFGYLDESITKEVGNINNISNDNNLYHIININDYFEHEFKINNNLFGNEFIGINVDKLIGISSGIKFYINSDTNNSIYENYILNINDTITIDYSNVNAKITDDFYIELSILNGEPDYETYNSYVDYMQIFGTENSEDYFERQIYKANSVKIKFNFDCYQNCETCEFVGISSENQKCLSCKDNIKCYMESENNCFDINSLTYKFYNDNGILKCVPLDLPCPDDYPFENTITKECKNNITFDDLISKNFIYPITQSIIEKIITFFDDKIKNKNIDINQDIIINNDNAIFHMTTPKKQEYYLNNGIYNNISSIDLNECEDILKKEYNISDPLTILKIDLKRKDTPTTQVEYLIINPENGDILNISKCDNVKIDIYSPSNFSQDYHNLIIQMKEQGYDIFDPKDPFYNDICSPYNSENDTDVLLIDRKKDFYNPNLSLCEDICEYKHFDIKVSKVKCECDKKTEIIIDSSKRGFSPIILFENFYSFKKYTNYKVLKCLHLAFDFNRFKNNIGSYIILSIILSFIVTMIIIFITQKKKYNNLLDQIIKLNLFVDRTIKNNEKNIIKIENNERQKKDDNNKNMNKIESKNDNDENQKKNELSLIKNNKRKIKMKRYKKEQINKINLKNNIFNENISEIRNRKNESNLPKQKINKLKKLRIKSSKICNIYFDKEINRSISMNNSSAQKLKGHLNSPYITKYSQQSLKNGFYISSSNSSIIEKKNKNKKNLEKKELEEEKEGKIKEKKNERINQISKNIPKAQRYLYFIDREINGLNYKHAVLIDFRSLYKSYWSLLKQTHLIIFTFITKDDYNLFFSKISLFLLSLALNITSNALFFNDDSMHKIYEDYGKFDFLYNLPQAIYSIFISKIFTSLFEFLSLSEDILSKFKVNMNMMNLIAKKQIIIRYLIIKSIIFFISGLIILFSFWYYISCFCAVYSNSQVYLIKDTFISFIIGMIYPFILILIPTIIRIPALESKNICLYKFSRILTTVISFV